MGAIAVESYAAWPEHGSAVSALIIKIWLCALVLAIVTTTLVYACKAPFLCNNVYYCGL